MKIKYSEKLLEDVVKDHPQEFLGIVAKLYKQQLLLNGFKPDLVFVTTENEYIIVELQINALDRHHLYKTLEYRDLFKKSISKNVKVILFCNSIIRRYSEIASSHNIEIVCMSKERTIELITRLMPNLKIECDT